MPDDTWMGGALDPSRLEPISTANAADLQLAGFSALWTPQTVILMVFIGIALWAGVNDLLRGTIPNTINTALFVLWVAWVVTGGPASVFASLGIGAAIFVLGAVLFHFGQMGGGDVKMLTVLGIWAGPDEILIFLTQVAFAGGLLTMFWIAHFRFLAPALGRIESADSKRVVPYGVAIAAGALLLAARLWTS